MASRLKNTLGHKRVFGLKRQPKDPSLEMEGFLLKKGKGESSFGRRNWKKRWFILEGQKLSYYEDLDKNFAPVGLKGSIDVKGCEVAPAEHKDKQFVFTLKPLNDHAVQYQAMDQKSFNGSPPPPSPAITFSDSWLH